MNEIRRLILAAILFMIGITLWNTWQTEHAPPEPITSPNVLVAHTDDNAVNPTLMPVAAATLPTAQRYIAVKTNTFIATIDRIGGNLVNLKLLRYPVSTTNHTPKTLLNQDPDTFYIAKSGFRGTDLATHLVFSSAQPNYTLVQGATPIKVILQWHNAQGLNLTKTYTFPANGYLIQVQQTVDNQTQTNWQGQFFAELQRKPVNAGGMGPFHFNTYLGGAISSPQKRYEKVAFKDMDAQAINRQTANGWLAMIQHYFLSAWIPNPSESMHYYSQVQQDIYTLGLQSAVISVAPKQQYTTAARLYVGPELADTLAKIAPGLPLTVDYGILWFIAVIIFWWMKKIFLLTGNWGWSIILVTLTIKLIFYKLNSISFRSMAAMRNLQPKLQQLRERHGDDKQKMAQATMELYKTEKVNPLSGCLPMLVQIPVFLSLYWVLVESVELRQAPFILWIHDLSIKDPYYVLPIIMGLTIFIQQWIAPKPADPMQRNIMLAMPVVFTAFFLSMPAGLVLYWVANNTLSILQQWYIMKFVVRQPAPPTEGLMKKSPIRKIVNPK